MEKVTLVRHHHAQQHSIDVSGGEQLMSGRGIAPKADPKALPTEAGRERGTDIPLRVDQ